mmetsp:Transcript_15483/g.17688  ORF Transcript_15483/g.17688 Transcript_15483/m.17688 type:complete len:370 (+) Transcript_15483:100-1209(+)
MEDRDMELENFLNEDEESQLASVKSKASVASKDPHFDDGRSNDAFDYDDEERDALQGEIIDDDYADFHQDEIRDQNDDDSARELIEEYGYENEKSSDWRALQEEYLHEKAVRKHPRKVLTVRDQSPIPTRKTKEVSKEAGHRLYNYGLNLQRKKEAMSRQKQREEEEYKPTLNLVSKKRYQSAGNPSRSDSTPRFIRLYDQGQIMNKKKQSLKEQQEKDENENRKLRLESRSSSRARQSSSVPRYLHLYEKSKLKQAKEQQRQKANEVNNKPIRKNVGTPQRINHLYDLSRRSQQMGRERRQQIEQAKKKESIPKRAISVGRRSTTSPLDVGLYNRGLAQMRKLEALRKQSAAQRDDNEYDYKSSVLAR